MADSYHHGVRVFELNGITRAIRSIETAIVGIVATAEDADAETFPLNEPVLLSSLQVAIGKAGTKGTLAKSLQAIANQTSTFVVVVRVQDAVDEAAQSANVIGTTEAGKYTGLKALLTAKTKLNVTPRIIGAPGLETPEVAQELVVIAQKLRAFTYAYCHGCATKEEAAAYRDSFGQREIMLLWPNFIAFNVHTKTTEVVPVAAVALGLRAKIDNSIGWHKTLSNVAVNGVTGIEIDVTWDLQDPVTDAGYLNSNEITTLIRKDGFRFWGSRTCSDEFVFENYTRTAQIIADTIAEAQMWAIDQPLHPSLPKDIIESINAKLNKWTREGYLIGAECWLDPDANTKETLMAGECSLDYDYTPVPPLENLKLRQRFVDKYLIDFAAKMAK